YGRSFERNLRMKLINAANLSEDELDQILSVLQSGGVIGFPTDTAYGLGADPFNDDAIARIFSVKGRPESKPILLLVDSIEMAERVAVPVPQFREVAETFWPGPLTIVLPAMNLIPATVTASSGTVGIRWPKAPFATRLISAFGKPITATSANRSGQP